MREINEKQQDILLILLKFRQPLSSSAVYEQLAQEGANLSLVTTKRYLSDLTARQLVSVSGSGRSTTYSIAVRGRILADVNSFVYTSIEPDRRYGLSSYNFSLFPEFDGNVFSASELQQLTQSTREYEKKIQGISPVAQKKELERLVIELAWKSSRIEGNTYTLLDTERLLLENKEAANRSRSEAKMIINHKEAFEYVRSHRQQFAGLNSRNLEELHAVMVEGLGVELGFRSSLVGITGSIYRPLDNRYQIAEAVQALSEAVDRCPTAYAKALLVLSGIGYIQPFVDGNKRTSRLMANAILMANSLAPLSYRSIDEDEYRNAMLVFYELNSLVPLKRIFLEQYSFAASNYAIK